MRCFQAVFLFLFAFSIPAFGQTADHCSKGNSIKLDGECWKSISNVAKINTVRGIWMGSMATRISSGLINQSPSYFLDRDWLEVPDSTTIGDISKYFDRLYETPANRKIVWYWAYVLAAMNARDDDSDDRLNLIRFLRQHDYVPLSGELVRAKSADTIVIKQGDSTFDIHLSGVTEKGLTPAQKKKAMSFINGLRRSSFGGCKTPMDTIIQLKYSPSLFQGDNRLSATAIIQAIKICTQGGELNIADISGSGTTKLYLNFVLVRYGLAAADTYLDPKWPDNLAKYTNETWASDKARDEGLYIYGGKVNAAVEKILAKSAQQ